MCTLAIAPLLCCHSDHEEQLWVWQYEAEDGRHDLFMDVEEEVRLRVIHEEFVDTFPSSGRKPPSMTQGRNYHRGRGGGCLLAFWPKFKYYFSCSCRPRQSTHIHL